MPAKWYRNCFTTGLPILDGSSGGSLDFGTEVHTCLFASFVLKLGGHVIALSGSSVGLEEGCDVFGDYAHLN